MSDIPKNFFIVHTYTQIYFSLTGKQTCTERSNGPNRQTRTSLPFMPHKTTGSHPVNGSSVGEFVGLILVGMLEGLDVVVTGALEGGMIDKVGVCEGSLVGTEVGLVDGASVGHGPHSPASIVW